MKTLITLILLLTITTAHGQLFAGAGLGISNVSPVAELQVGYQIPKTECRQYRTAAEGLLISAGYITAIDNENACMFYLKGGKSFYIDDFTDIQPMVGYAWHKVSNDDKTKNGKATMYSISFVRYANLGAWLIGLHYSNNNFSGTIGLRFLFNQ